MLVSRTPRARVAGLCGALALLAAPAAQAGVMDFLFGGSDKSAEAGKPESRRKTWTLHEFSAIRLVPRESASTPNQHPLQIDGEVLRQQLAQVRFGAPPGTQPLFAADELAELVEPLSQALANAGPDEDLLLLSTSRRGAGVLAQPLGITARLFVQGGSLQLLVNDARFEFMNQYLGSRVPPTFTFGSRARPGTASLRSASGSNQRADWIALPMLALAAVPAQPLPTAAAAVAVPAAPVAAPAAATAPAPRPRDPGFAEDIEQRLLTLDRLRKRGLISEDEYQQKRREILQRL